MYIIMQIHSERGFYMKMLNVRFSEVQKLKIDDVAEVVDIDFSKVARAAMRLGMQQILILASADIDKAKDLILINDARSK